MHARAVSVLCVSEWYILGDQRKKQKHYNISLIGEHFHTNYVNTSLSCFTLMIDQNVFASPIHTIREHL